MNLQYLTLPAMQHTQTLPTRLPAQDLVTTCWERELLQFILRHHLLEGKEHFRCISIGDSQDELYITLHELKTTDSRLDTVPVYWIQEANWELFMALNLNGEEVESLNEKYNTEKKVRFFRHDYRQGLGLFRHEKPFDLYWLGIEATQHSQASLGKILSETILHAQGKNIIALDFVGKYNVANLEGIEGWDENMVTNFLKELPTQDKKVRVLKKIDRSIFLHEPLRTHVQSLFTPFQRTDLQKLIITNLPIPPYATQEAKDFFEKFQYCWNALVRYTIDRFSGNLTPPEDWEEWIEMPISLKYSLKSTEKIINDNDWVAYGDIRANVLEPHLGYALRHLEYELQKGLGTGQYFTILLEVL